MATITQTISTVTSLPTPPDPNSPSTFDSLAYPYTVAQNAFGVDVNDMAVELNAFATQTNAVRDEVNTLRGDTVTAKDAAIVAQGLAEDARDEAVAAVATLPDGVINDATTTLVDTWSSSKISSELDGKLDLAGGTMTGAITSLRETKVAMAANDINLASGNLFTKTISGSTTLTVSNIPTTGQTIGFVLELTNGGSSAVTWFSGVKWAGGTAPTLTTTGIDTLGFITHDGGTTWYAYKMGLDMKAA